MPIMRSQKAEPVLRPHELYVYQMLREVIAISKAESQSAKMNAGGNCNEKEQPKPQGNTRHDEVVRCPNKSRMILLGYES
jgi:hypothetical protein